MNISELISQLNALRMKYGEIDVFVNNYEIILVSYDDDDNVINIEG